MDAESKILKPNAEQITQILAAHKLWTEGKDGGSRANLRGAYLSDAYLSGAYLPTGELWEQYLAEVLPALLIAGGKTIDEVIGSGAWECHTWQNCPMHAAFGISSADEAPALLRPRVEQFVQFFDSGLIVAVKDESGKWVFKSSAQVKSEPPAAATATS